MNLELFAEKYRAKSTRLKYYDYSQSGMYFVTICTQGREEFFGEVRNGVMGLNEVGCMANKNWLEIPNHFQHVRLSDFVVMPNHFHGIVVILNDNVETHCNVSLREHKIFPKRNTVFPYGDAMNKFGPQRNNLSSIIRGFKSSVKRWCNQNGHEHFSWQSRFYEHVIRSENDLDNIREYIINNPTNWYRDRNNPDVFTESPSPFCPPPPQ